MKRLVLLPLIFTTACLGGPAFTVGEAPDSGPLLAELVPDALVAEDGRANDPPDADPPDALAAKGDTRDSADGGQEAETAEASTPEASIPEETSTPEASMPEASAPQDSGTCAVGETRCYYVSPYAGSECSASQAGYPQVCAIDQVGAAPSWGYPGGG